MKTNLTMCSTHITSPTVTIRLKNWHQFMFKTNCHFKGLVIALLGSLHVKAFRKHVGEIHAMFQKYIFYIENKISFGAASFYV